MSITQVVQNVAQVRATTDPLDPSGGAACEVKFAAIDVAAAQTDAVLIAAVTGKKLRILDIFIQGGAACTVLFESEDPAAVLADKALSGTIAISGTAGTPFEVKSEFGVFETRKGDRLVVTNVGGGGTLDGYLSYIEV